MHHDVYVGFAAGAGSLGGLFLAIAGGYVAGPGFLGNIVLIG
jgi:hypothetical protein